MADQRSKPAIWLCKVEQAVSHSRLGGLPALPDDVGWPSRPGTQVPLHFLGQVDLTSLPATPLPGSDDGAILPPQGMLFFFIDFSNPRAVGYGVPKVIHSTSAGTAHALPDTLPPMDFMGFGFSPPGGDPRLFPIVHLKARVVDTHSDDYDYPKPIGWRMQMFGVANGKTDEGRAAIAEGRHLLMEFVDESLGELLTYEGLVQVWMRPDDLKSFRFDKALGGLSPLLP